MSSVTLENTNSYPHPLKITSTILITILQMYWSLAVEQLITSNFLFGIICTIVELFQFFLQSKFSQELSCCPKSQSHKKTTTGSDIPTSSSNSLCTARKYLKVRQIQIKISGLIAALINNLIHGKNVAFELLLGRSSRPPSNGLKY